jgi:hypothetical protein
MSEEKMEILVFEEQKKYPLLQPDAMKDALVLISENIGPTIDIRNLPRLRVASGGGPIS